MDTTKKTKLTVNLSNEAVDVLRFQGYCTDRTIGAFLSKLILDYHKLHRGSPTPSDVAAQLRAIADALDKTAQDGPGRTI